MSTFYAAAIWTVSSRGRSKCLSVSSWVFFVLLMVPARFSVAADFGEARGAYFAGDFDRCIELCSTEVENGIWNEFWSRLLIETLLTTGQYEEAREIYELVESKFSNSIALRVLGAEAYRYSGDSERASQLLSEIPDLVNAAAWRFTDRENLLAIGRYVLSRGEDARKVLETYYDRVLKGDSKYVDAHVAIAELALDKADYQEAVKSLTRALELQPSNPRIQFLLAKAWAPSDSEKASEHLRAALDLNPYHTESLLLQARNLIDSERYDAAEDVLGEVQQINETNPSVWALKAAIAHLRGEYKQEGEFRSKALAHWNLNPAVDYLIGATLSKHYRFAEGVQYQRRALRMDVRYMPAKFQLAQDLLRIGQDDEGWLIVDQVSVEDKYNVVAFNLKTLQDKLAGFTTIEVPGFIVRMEAREARIYGPRVVKLLTEARTVLSAKYDFEVTKPVSVEIFPQQSDFAIRTFGLPGGAGFLGVCFGGLITANSPASQGESPSNWESVLWHEFCHVITLQKTNNRMPRWLSEGISVYEEVQRNPSWGQRMNPMYKSMLLGEDFVPLSQLSGAFLNPKSALHLQFAYFESSLAVQYLVEQHGDDLLRQVLVDLGMGVPIEDAFTRRFGDPQVLDDDFANWVKGCAGAFEAGTDFGRDGLPERASSDELADWIEEHPGSYFAQRQLVEQLIQRGRWEDALPQARKLLELFPEDTDTGGALDVLARIARELEDVDLETQMLSRTVELTSDNVRALTRLIALRREAEDWPAVAEFAQQMLAVQPLLPIGHEALVEASLHLGKPDPAIGSLQALKEMEPLDPAGLSFQLAVALFDADRVEEARIEVLLTLEQTPRYRAAQKLLVRIHDCLHARPAEIEVASPLDGRPPSPRREPVGL